MAFTHRNGRARVWLNEYKKEGDKTPTWKGNGMVGGIVWDVAIWEDDDGGLSLKFDEPAHRRKTDFRSIREELEDDLPDSYK